MRLSPLDIRKQEFKKVMRGVDHEEVEAFLNMIADEFETLIREKNQLSEDVLKLRTQLRDYQHVEHTLRETLVSARQSLEESKANSQREAEMIIREAELKAERIIEDAKEELMELRNEIRLLKSQKDSFVKRLKYLLESQLDLISTLEIDDAEISEERKSAAPRMKSRLSQTQLHHAEEAETMTKIPKAETKIINSPEVRIGQPAPALESNVELEFEPSEFETLAEHLPPSTENNQDSQENRRRISNQFII